MNLNGNNAYYANLEKQRAKEDDLKADLLEATKLNGMRPSCENCTFLVKSMSHRFKHNCSKQNGKTVYNSEFCERYEPNADVIRALS